MSVILQADVDGVEDLLAPEQTTAKASKYALKGVRVRTVAGGIVARADGQPLLVHTGIPSRPEQAIDVGAVVSALLHGALPLDSIVLAFKRADKLAELTAAVARAQPVEAPKAKAPAAKAA